MKEFKEIMGIICEKDEIYLIKLYNVTDMILEGKCWTHPSTQAFQQPGFLSLGTIDIWDQVILRCGGCPGHCRTCPLSTRCG